MPEFKKRETAYKLRIGDILKANQIFEEDEGLNKRLQFVEIGDKKILRVNIIANVIDKFESEGERKFASITLDDGSGQIRARVFGNEITKLQWASQGDTLIIIGLLRSYNQELYILPELIKKADPKYLLVRKLEIEKTFSKPLNSEQKNKIKVLRDEIIDRIKAAESKEGIDKEEIILTLKNSKPEIITQELQKLLEEGIIYEPRPGRVRYLG
jgi:RPA family protein